MHPPRLNLHYAPGLIASNWFSALQQHPKHFIIARILSPNFTFLLVLTYIWSFCIRHIFWHNQISILRYSVFQYYSELSFKKLTIFKKSICKEDVMSSCAGVNCEGTCQHVDVGDDALCWSSGSSSTWFLHNHGHDINNCVKIFISFQITFIQLV